MKASHMFGLVGACCTMAMAGDVLAGSPQATTTPQPLSAYVLKIGDGNLGRMPGTGNNGNNGNARVGPGWEQETITNVVKGGVSYLVVIAMQSMDGDYGPWQCSCESFQLNETSAPSAVAPITQLTYLKGNNRNCNHPKAVTVPDPGDPNNEVVMWMYGSDYNNNRPMTYAAAVDEKCQAVAAPILVSSDPNQNEGAPDIVYNGQDANGVHATGAYLSTGGNNDVSYALGLTLTKSGLLYSLQRDWLTAVVTPSNIGRPSLAPGGLGRTLFTASTGHQRPQEIGVTAAWLNAQTGDILWKDVVAPSNPQNMSYVGQPTVAVMQPFANGTARYALNVLESNGKGKNSNLKGSNLAHLYALDVDSSDAVTVSAHSPGLPSYQTHSTITAGAYGVNGDRVVAYMSASPTGIGRAFGDMVTYDSVQKAFALDTQSDSWPTSWYADSGHLANWYGENPMRQGRNFLRPIGDVANPGFGKANGFMPNVQTFFAVALDGREPGDMKNSMYLSLIPGQVNLKAVPGNPVGAGTPPAPAPAPTTSGSGTAAGAAKGCACTATGASSRGDLGWGIAMLGLALGAVFARRRG